MSFDVEEENALGAKGFNNTDFELIQLERAWPWALRASWLTLPFTLGQLVNHFASSCSTPVKITVVALFWLWWTAGLLATAVPHPAGLVVIRCASTAALVSAFVGSWLTHHRLIANTATSVASIACGLIAFAASQFSETGHWCVNGPAYANERRFMLRPPALVMLGLAELSCALMVLGTIVGPLLLAAKQWIAGAAATAVGAGLAYISFKSLYALAQRFLVFVPAGFVVHDRETLRDPILFLRRFIEVIRPAPHDSDSLDLSANAPGLRIEVLLTDKIEVTRVKNSRDLGEIGKTARYLVVPTLPGRLLKTAASRRFPTA